MCGKVEIVHTAACHCLETQTSAPSPTHVPSLVGPDHGHAHVQAEHKVSRLVNCCQHLLRILTQLCVLAVR